MPIKLLSAAAVLAVFAVTPVFACERHLTHAPQTTVAAAPVTVAPEVAVSLPQSSVPEAQALSVVPEVAAAYRGYGGCEKRQTTVYLTN